MAQDYQLCMDIILMRRYAELSWMADKGEKLSVGDWKLMEALEKDADA